MWSLIRNLNITNLYFQKLLKRHIVYFIACAFFSFITFVFIPVQIEEYYSLNKESEKLLSEIEDLQARKKFVEGYQGVNTAELVATVNSLLPSVEDKFSIFNSLDRLELETGVRVTSFSSPFRGKEKDQVSVKVQTFANRNVLLNFLKEYQFSSGRFMLLDNIAFNPDKSSLSFTALYPVFDVVINAKSLPKLNSEVIKQLTDIRAKYFTLPGEVIINNKVDELQNINYAPRENPFGDKAPEVTKAEAEKPEATKTASASAL